MIVWRMEDKNEWGPYSRANKGSRLRHMNNEHSHYSSNHPTLGINKEGQRIGMSSLNGLKRWFAGYMPALMRNGFRAVMYFVNAEHVEEGPHGDGQVRFLAHRAKRIKSYSPLHLTDRAGPSRPVEGVS